MNRKIVADSSCDVTVFPEAPFSLASLKILTSEKEYVDNDQLDVAEMVDDLKNYSGRSSTSCPNTQDWLDAFGDADEVFCVTITSNLSGAYNAAMTAKAAYEKAHPNRRVLVIDSLSTGPEMLLIMEKIAEMIREERSFDEISNDIAHYQQHTGLLFMLENMNNLANNGRVSPVIAKVAGLLGIRVVGKASDVGTLEQLNKCRGERKALDTLVRHLKELGFNGGKIRIGHCFNPGAAVELKARILNQFEKARITIHECRGLCSFYAEMGGLLLGFEKA
ncbi:MAG: DegV family protein [Clostridia bacterium]|nr:DegV family protein [Clostridia bacterium]